MLNVFQQRQTLVRWVMGIILFLVCITMVITLIPGLGGTSDTINNPVVADVAGDRITQSDIQQSLQQVSLRNSIPPEMMPFYTNQILNEMILQKASLHEARRLGLKVDKSELVAQLRKNPSLFPNGVFVGQDAYEDMVSERFGMSVPEFEQHYRDALLVNKLRQLVTDSVMVTPEEVHKAFIAENEKVVLNYVALNPDNFKKEIKPTESDLEQYYKKNKLHYRVFEQRRAKILLVTRAKVRQGITISDAVLKKYYQAHLDNYRVPERVKASHILLRADTKNPAQLKAAKKKAEEIIKKLKGGADFAALAKKYSDDKVSGAKGGSLGWVTRRQTVAEFEKAAFSLKPGTVSGPVQTVYGIHIIKVFAHEQAHLQSFDEVKPKIKAQLTAAKVAQTLSDDADQAAKALAKPGADINAIAKKYHAEVLSPPPFMQTDNLPRIQSTAFMHEVFGLTAKGQSGPPVQVEEGYAIPYVLEVIPGHLGKFAEVKNRVKTDYIGAQSKAQTVAKAKALAGLLARGRDLKKAAGSLKLEVMTSPAVTHNGMIPSVGSVKDLGAKPFTLAVGATAGPVAMKGSGTEIVYQVASREAPKETEFAAKKAQIKQQLLNSKQASVFNVFQESLKRKLAASGDLKLHEDVLARLTAAGGQTP